MIYVPSRVKRHKNKFAMDTGLNLVSLMDIFTILLLFLLFHVSGEEETITVPDIVSLPASISTVKPEPTTTIYITGELILVGDKKVANTQDVLKSSEPGIDSLEKELLSQMSQNVQDGEQSVRQDKIIIMGDKMIPFTLLKKVMYTCSMAGYPTLSLAVIQKE
ncbi:MAG TPA: RNA polymerase subunit sigma-70 [Bacteroidales bacterium]|nr:RNA polymerase subunit sigma-70 [Bacteroidales bacterium]